MSFYPEVPARRHRQMLGDLLVAAWVVAWAAVGRAVYDAVARLGEPGRAVEEAGLSLDGSLRAAADGVARAPVIGDDLSEALRSAGDAALGLAQAGMDARTGAERLALLAATSVAVWPIVVVAGCWALHRWRTARRAAVVRRVLARPDGADLLALRALARAPLPRLADAALDPVDAWRRGDPDAIRALAAVAMRDAGLDARRSTPGSSADRRDDGAAPSDAGGRRSGPA